METLFKSTKGNMKRFQFLGPASQPRPPKRRKMLSRVRPEHDPMLVLNMVMFTFAKSSKQILTAVR
jgi:hypothetical protein